MSPDRWKLSRNQEATRKPACEGAPHSRGAPSLFVVFGVGLDAHLFVFVGVLLCVLLISCAGPSLPDDPADRVVFRACEFLWEKQLEDGGWHSDTHGLMRGGEATTAFVLHALLGAGEACPHDDGARERALDFLRTRVNKDGVLGLSDPDIVDYPNYATAYALIILVRHGQRSDRELILRMQDYLVAQQFDDDRGIESGHPAYGGWGFGESVLPAGGVGHVDLSHTRRVLEAIRAAGHTNADTYDRARSFLRLLQKDPGDDRARRAGMTPEDFDGGFFASAVLPVVNKSSLISGAGDIYIFSSYATATADGLISLLAAGAALDDESVLAAKKWLSLFPNFDYPAGIPRDDPSDWGRVMFFYHLMVRAEAYRKLAEPGSWREDLALVLMDRQQQDGRFSNPYGAPNKEDDPLIATSMVVVALAQE